MKILVACEESQAVTKELRRLGHEAYSCDLQECTGGHPEWHVEGDCLPLINGNCTFTTVDGQTHTVAGKWDLLIAHPPCTYLSHVANRCHSLKCYPLEAINERTHKRIEGMEFFMKFVDADCDRIAIENPTGVMNTAYRKPDQTIQPWYFAEDVNDEANYQTKRTHLWLKGLEPLQYDPERLPPVEYTEKWANGKRKNWTENNHGGRNRSKTFPGVAKAMAEQWAGPAEAVDDWML